MKKSLADQVREYIDYKGDGYTASRLASDVAKHQRDLPEGDRCKRQNIEQLLEKNFRTVRYQAALAAAMGTTVEALSAGTFVPGANPPAPIPGEPTIVAPTLAQALEVVAGALSSVPPEKRQALLAVLATYSSNPAHEKNSLDYLQSELAKTEGRQAIDPATIATGVPPGGKA